jgi:hypothetical protein
MADLAAVEQALVTAIAGIVYPGGTGAASALGAGCRIYRGWPVANALDADLKAGLVNISVYPRPGMTQMVAGHPKEWVSLPAPAATLTATVAGSTITLAGVGAVTHLMTAVVNGNAAYSLRCTAGQSPASIAAALAALIPGGSAAGAVVTVSGAVRLLARVGVDTPALRELRRQRQGVQVTLWCPDPATRDLAGSLVDIGLAGSSFLALPDGTSARLLYTGTSSDDAPAKEVLFRRDLMFSVEYSTVEASSFPVVTSVEETLAGAPSPSTTLVTALVAPITNTLVE